MSDSFHIVVFFLAGALGGLWGFGIGTAVMEARREPPPAVAQAEVVRMLDIVIRDSNTSNVRQKFECRPAGVWPSPHTAVSPRVAK